MRGTMLQSDWLLSALAPKDWRQYTLAADQRESQSTVVAVPKWVPATEFKHWRNCWKPEGIGEKEDSFVVVRGHVCCCGVLFWNLSTVEPHLATPSNHHTSSLLYEQPSAATSHHAVPVKSLQLNLTFSYSTYSWWCTTRALSSEHFYNWMKSQKTRYDIQWLWACERKSCTSI